MKDVDDEDKDKHQLGDHDDHGVKEVEEDKDQAPASKVTMMAMM